MQLYPFHMSLPLMFSLADIRSLLCPKQESLKVRCDKHVIVAFASGEGMYEISHTKWKLEAGLCMLLPPGSEIEWHAGMTEIQGFVLSFDVFRWGGNAPLPLVNMQWPYYKPILVAPFTRFLDPMNRIRLYTEVASDAERMRQTILLQELICILLEINEQSVKLASVEEEERLRITIRYLNNHYLEPITVEQLARMAGMKRSKYSAAFQSSIGRKPLEYLNDLRIEQAIKLLEGNEQPLREIARQVGYNDEYYFNRRFTKRIGIPPGMYARLSRTPAEELVSPYRTVVPSSSALRIVVTGYALGELLTLGITPVGAELTVMGSQVVFSDLLHGVVDVGLLGDPALIKELRPDLIILGSKLHRDHTQLSLIAPTTIVDSSLQLTERLIAVADMLGRREAAVEWISDYERRWEEMWANVAGEIKPEETASVLLLHMGQLYMMGKSGFAATLYHPDGFKPSNTALELHRYGEDFRQITADALADLDGDRLFLLVDPEKASNQNTVLLMNHPKWRSLDAVKEGRFHMADSSWNYDDSITRDRLLTVLPHIMRARTELHTNESGIVIETRGTISMQHAL
ncbi:AraC family transcriptional regulator [Paenibacillus sinopodophylli]|uniref:AraC family transcriptional regulator n=1 Tax=Paenibacillus sinopodophylli TaxID=1837342 RepID=UPI00110CDBCC|nr:AraC family transcriptional regulator [Paenibacillus sinopodophylli]